MHAEVRADDEIDQPKSKLIGLWVHHPNSTKNGIQNSKNWILRSIALASATLVGGSIASLNSSEWSTCFCQPYVRQTVTVGTRQVVWRK